MKTKRLMSIVLALAMICTMFGNLTAFGNALWVMKPKFCISVTDNYGNAVEGVKYKITYTQYTDQAEVETDETSADGTTQLTLNAENESTCTLTFTEFPTGYTRPSYTEMIISLDGSTEQFTEQGMTATYDSEANLYTLGLTLQLQQVLPSGAPKVKFKMSAQDSNGLSVSGVKYKVGDSDETDADGTSILTKQFYGYGETSTLSITQVPKGYKIPNDVTVSTRPEASDFADTGYEAVVTREGLEDSSVELTLTLENDTDDDTTYTISIDPMYNTNGGTITIDKTTAKAGEKIKASVKLNDGYDCSYVSFSDYDDFSFLGVESQYTTEADGTRIYEITMPANNLILCPYLYAIEYTYLIYFNDNSVDENELKYQLTVGGVQGEETSFKKNADNTNEAKIVLPYSDKDKTVEFKITGVPYGYKIPEVFTFTCGEKPDYDLAPDNYKSLGDLDRFWNISFHLDLVLITNLSVMAQGQNEMLPEDSVKYTLTVDGTTTEEITMRPTESFDVENLNVNGKNATIIVTQVPDGYLVPEPISFAFDGNNEAFKNTQYELVAVSVNPETSKATYAILVKLEKKPFESPFTVSAKVNSTTVDRDIETEGTQVNAKDTVKVDVVVSGEDFTNADWELVYNPTLFKYVGTTTNVDTTKSTVTLDDSKTAVLSGKVLANAGVSANDEFADGTAIVTYEFEALAQKKDVTGLFKIESAHANNYEMAGTLDNYAAKTADATVEIVLVDDEDKEEENGTVTVPAGTFTATEKTYNAQKQTGNAFELDDNFANAKVTYFANEDGSAVEDTAELETKSFKTTLPSWKNVGEYTYYAKIYGDGLKKTYVSTTLTIKPAEITPSAMFKVDPDVNEVEFTPTLEGVLDGTHNGKVTISWTDGDGNAQSETLEASNFVYDGETTSVYNGKITTKAPTSGEFKVTLTYTSGDADNYKGGTNTAKVDVDKITADSETVAALEETITNVFGYDSEAHGVEVDEYAVADVEKGDWEAAISETEATVTNVGDDKMVKVTFTDKSGVYNDVIVYVILKVTPAKVKITVDNNSKVMNSADPTLTGTVKVVDEDGNEVTGVTFNQNGLYGEDNLEVSYEREAGEDVGKYVITASYAPNDNYTVEVVNGEFEITAPEIDPENPEDAIVKVEVVDLSEGGTKGDETPDYTADKRLILVYTDVDKLFYGYKVDEDTTEKMFDVTAAGYKYVENDYETGKYTKDGHEYKHVYGIVVDAIDTYEATETYEQKYRDNVVFLSSSLEDAPENIVYDGDINLSNEIDVNDYSMTNGIYNNQYARATYIKNILKADINGSKKVDTTDVLNVKQLFEAKNK